MASWAAGIARRSRCRAPTPKSPSPSRILRVVPDALGRPPRETQVALSLCGSDGRASSARQAPLTRGRTRDSAPGSAVGLIADRYKRAYKRRIIQCYLRDYKPLFCPSLPRGHRGRCRATPHGAVAGSGSAGSTTWPRSSLRLPSSPSGDTSLVRRAWRVRLPRAAPRRMLMRTPSDCHRRRKARVLTFLVASYLGAGGSLGSMPSGRTRAAHTPT